MRDFINKYGLYLVWVTSLSAMAGSLYFSEVMKLPPCVLCWYQRILMYPLVIIGAVGILRKDREVYKYILPMSILGMVIAIGHNLLYYKIIPESYVPCVNGISCTTKYFEWFGFITIPFLSLVAFTFITIIMFLFKHYQKENYENI